MEFLCPECMGTLVTRDGKTAVCTLDGRRYDILFMKAAPAAAVPPPPAPLDVSGQQCIRHANKPAKVTCNACGRPICDTCSFPQAPGGALCPDCATRPMAPALPPEPVEGVMCVSHPHLQAVHLCKSCGAGVCPTCDFELPGHVHVCPRCATSPTRKMSGKRKRLVVAGLILAVWCSVGLALLLSGAIASMADTEGEAAALGIGLSFFVFIPTLVGTALSFAALERRLGNPMSAWVAVVWNCINLGAYGILIIIGTFMS